MDKPFAITLDVGSSLANKTGSWRTFRPVYLDRMPPCNNQCPAGENIQAWLYYAEEGRYEEAWRKIMEENPFPAVMGRVCYHTCESACNRAKVDESVGINGVERFLGDQAIKYDWKVAPGAPTGGMVVSGTPRRHGPAAARRRHASRPSRTGNGRASQRQLPRMRLQPIPVNLGGLTAGTGRSAVPAAS